MGIKFYCPSCDKRLNVKSFLAGKAGFCPHCQAKLQIPVESQPKRAKSAEGEDSTILRQPAAHPNAPGESPAAAPNEPQGSNGHGKPHAAPAPVAVVPQPAPTHIPGFAPAAAPIAAAIPGGAYSYAAAGHPAGHAAPGGQPAAYGGHPYHQGSRPEFAAPIAPVAAPIAPVAPLAAAPAMMDPIAEAPHCVWYVRPPAGGQYGPAAGDVMRKWMGEGRIGGESLVWREGWPDWRKASKVFPSLAPAAAPAGMAPAAPVTPVAAMTPATSPRRNIRTPRKQNSTAVAVTAISVLVVMSIGLLIGLLYVLGAF